MPRTELPTLVELEAEANRRGLLLRLQVSRPAGLTWALRVGVARQQPGAGLQPCPAVGQPGSLVLLGELKGWALPTADGLRLDTMRVQGEQTAAVGPLIWAATWAWALEATPCRRATILAIRDNEPQHRRLVRYFKRLGFIPLRELGAGPFDLAPRLVWGGSGLLMQGEVIEGLARSARRLEGAASGPQSSTSMA